MASFDYDILMIETLCLGAVASQYSILYSILYSNTVSILYSNTVQYIVQYAVQ